MLGQVLQRIGLVELVGIVRLRPVINANDLEASTSVADRCTACSAEQVQEAQRHRAPPGVALV